MFAGAELRCRLRHLRPCDRGQARALAVLGSARGGRSLSLHFLFPSSLLWRQLGYQQAHQQAISSSSTRLAQHCARHPVFH